MTDIRKRVNSKGTSYQVRYPSTTNRSGYAYASFGTLKEARHFVQNLGSMREPVSTSVRTVPQAVDLWLEICERIGRDGREPVERETLKEYRRRATIMSEYPWPKALQALETADVVQFRNWLLQHKTRDLARRTLSSFHSVLIEMKLQGHIRDDPAAGITIKQGGRYEEEDREVQIPSDREVRDILAAADLMGSKNDFMAQCWARYRPMIYLSAFSGMRSSEYRGLPWSNLHADRVEVAQRADKTGIIGPVKSRAARRSIELSRRVTDIVFEWRERCPPSEADLVFPTVRGRPILLANYLTDAWRPLLREVGLVKTCEVNSRKVERALYTPHALRHYFASKLIEKRKDPKFIQQKMGHSRIEITMNIYGHLMKDREEAHRLTAEELADDLLQH